MTDINIIDLAREVLGDELDWDVKPSDTMHHEDIEAVYRLANAAPALARAVLRVAMLTDRLDDRRLGYQIRTTLNGENR